MLHIRILITFILSTLLFHTADSIRWLEILNNQERLVWNHTSQCSTLPSFVKAQVKHCRRHLELMPVVEEATAIIQETCEAQFADRRWNCSTIRRAPDFSPDLELGTREQAYVYALSAATVAYMIAQRCASGTYTKCSCGDQPLEQQDGFQWGGCGDNIEFGMDFSARFADAHLTKRRRRRSADTLMNLHNNNAGRMALITMLENKCKCHGVSGSCSLQTCWRVLREIEAVGQELKWKYGGATEVMQQERGSRDVLISRDSHLKQFTERDLIYLNESPDYCDYNEETGSLGTQGRICNRTSFGNDGCDVLCCGRGYNTYIEERTEKCGCKYIWCCYVKCKECRQVFEVSVCK